MYRPWRPIIVQKKAWHAPNCLCDLLKSRRYLFCEYKVEHGTFVLRRHYSLCNDCQTAFGSPALSSPTFKSCKNTSAEECSIFVAEITYLNHTICSWCLKMGKTTMKTIGELQSPLPQSNTRSRLLIEAQSKLRRYILSINPICAFLKKLLSQQFSHFPTSTWGKQNAFRK